MPKGLALVREDKTLVRFAFPSLMYGVIALVGWACAVLAHLYFDGVRRGVFFVLMVVLGGVGTWGGLWREDINLDVSHRRYSLRRGFWPRVQTLQGSFDQIAGIFLAWETRSRRYGVYSVWVVRLALPGEKEGLTILSFDDENEALGGLKALSSRLGLPVIECPIGTMETFASGIPCKPLVGIRAGGEDESTAEFSWQSPEGRIVVSGQTPHRIIDLPPQTGIVSNFLVGVTSVFCLCVTIVIGLNKFAGFRVRQDTPRETLLIILLSYLTVSGLIVFALALSSIRERIEEDGSSLRFGTLMLGRSGTFTTLKKNEINSVSLEAALRVSGRGAGIFPNPNSLIRRVPIRAGPGKQEQVVIRSPLAVARVGVQLTPP
jgi:hypothetical protein